MIMIYIIQLYLKTLVDAMWIKRGWGDKDKDDDDDDDEDGDKLQDKDQDEFEGNNAKKNKVHSFSTNDACLYISKITFRNNLE